MIRHPHIILVALLVAFTAPTLAQTATGPTLKWSVPTAEAGNPQKLSLDGGVFNTVQTTATGEGSKTWLRYQFPAPLSPQSHTFKVQNCNALACTDSDALTVSPPSKPAELSLQ